MQGPGKKSANMLDIGATLNTIQLDPLEGDGTFFLPDQKSSPSSPDEYNKDKSQKNFVGGYDPWEPKMMTIPVNGFKGGNKSGSREMSR